MLGVTPDTNGGLPLPSSMLIGQPLDSELCPVWLRRTNTSPSAALFGMVTVMVLPSEGTLRILTSDPSPLASVNHTWLLVSVKLLPVMVSVEPRSIVPEIPVMIGLVAAAAP